MTSGGFWYVPPAVHCLQVDDETLGALRRVSRERVLLIDRVVGWAWPGLRYENVVLRWLVQGDPLPDRLLLVADVDDPVTFIRADLAPVMRNGQARLVARGPAWLGRFRRLRIDVDDAGAWLASFDPGAQADGDPP
jgi:hypothetical protein